MFRWVFIISSLFFAGKIIPVNAQISNLRTKKIAASGVIYIDTVSIVPQSLLIQQYDTSFYSFDAVESKLTWIRSTIIDSVTVSYRVFPFRFSEKFSRYTYDSIQNNFIAARPASSFSDVQHEPLLNFGNLTYNGSFGRSLSVGNAQDAVFNSQLNLQLNGFIGDSIELNAAITDNNIPIQPEGTTQQLNEFDRVLLQFRKKEWEVDLGDIDLRQNESYFLKFYKRLQGILYRQNFSINKNISNSTLISGAIAKGKFARNVFDGLEGNQGPYRLRGNNNELFFIVLAGTEKVFLNGIQVQRGEDQDYVINYNTAEIIFTPRQMITKDVRIQVEFEYADRSYLNTMLYATTETVIGEKLSLRISAYQNTDGKNAPINQQLDDKQKIFLSNLGDSVQNAFYPVSSIETFDENKILYKQADTVYNGISETIFVYSTNADSAKFALNFIEVGQNKGNYVPLFNAANGKVFLWVQPVDGVKRGNYEAATFLIAPRQQQVLSLALQYALNKKTNVYTEVASSKLDINTFSTKEAGNDKGYAAKFRIEHITSFSKKSGNNIDVKAMAGYEWVDAKFRPVERLRAVEFAREWGLPILPDFADEHLPFAGIEFSDAQKNNMLYKFSAYLRNDGFTAYKNEIQNHHTVAGLQVNNFISLIQNKTTTDKGFYLRPEVDISKILHWKGLYTVGASYALEHNESRHLHTDTVTPFSFAFETISAYIRSDESKNNRWSFNYFTRQNKIPYKYDLAQTDRSHNYNFKAEILQNLHHQLRISATYRRLFITDQKLIAQLPDNSILGRVEYLVNEWEGFLTGNVLYEIGAGQEQRRDYAYIEVPAGTGQYAWNDYNQDGIPQLNEFEIALFIDQAKYMRIYTPTNVYIKSNYLQFNYGFVLTPKAIEGRLKDGYFKKIITRFILQSSAQTFIKRVADGKPLYNPVKGSVNDTSLVALNYIVNNTLSYNRQSLLWGVDLSNVISYNKSLLTYGFETRRVNEWSLKGRVNFMQNYSFEMLQRYNRNDLITPAFANRNYALNEYNANPKFIYTNSTKYRVQLGYSLEKNKNADQYGGEKVLTNSMQFEGKYNSFSNIGFTGRFTFSDIYFTGEPNTTVSYIMLDALLPGKNFLWGIMLNKRFLNNLELSIEYDGRKPAAV